LRWQTSNCSSLLIYRPRKDERLSWPSWLISSGRFTHIVVTGHPLAEGRAQNRVSSPAKDRRSADCAMQPTNGWYITLLIHYCWRSNLLKIIQEPSTTLKTCSRS